MHGRLFRMSDGGIANGAVRVFTCTQPPFTSRASKPWCAHPLAATRPDSEGTLHACTPRQHPRRRHRIIARQQNVMRFGRTRSMQMMRSIRPLPPPPPRVLPRRYAGTCCPCAKHCTFRFRDESRPGIITRIFAHDICQDATRPPSNRRIKARQIDLLRIQT